MAQKITANFLIVPKWAVEGFPDYFFGADKQLYRYDSRGVIRKNKRLVVHYTQGYCLKGRFYSLTQLRPLLRPYEFINHPAGF